MKFCRHPDPLAFVAGGIAGSPIAGAVAEMAEADRTALFQKIVTEIGDNLDDGGLAVPAPCHTLTANR